MRLQDIKEKTKAKALETNMKKSAETSVRKCPIEYLVDFSAAHTRDF